MKSKRTEFMPVEPIDADLLTAFYAMSHERRQCIRGLIVLLYGVQAGRTEERRFRRQPIVARWIQENAAENRRATLLRKRQARERLIEAEQKGGE